MSATNLLIGFLLVFSAYLTIKNQMLRFQLDIYRAGFITARKAIKALITGTPEQRDQLTKELLEIEGLVKPCDR